jgi:hypothetical protein
MARPRARYRPDRIGLGKWAKTDPGLQAALVATAHVGKRYAESIAPVETGEYRDSFGVTEETGRAETAGAMLYNDSEHAAAVEFDHHHTLAQTADHLNAARGRKRSS